MPTQIDKSFQLNTIPEAIEAIRIGQVIIVVDDEDRENEGDFICAAELVTPEIINFMSTHGRGLICTPIEEHRADKLDLPLMVQNNTAMHETAFTVSIDLIGHGCTTGISAYDRATCIKALIDSNAKASDFARPGHIFPLRAKTGGVLRRTGHTEAAIDLAQLAGLKPAGVLVEILNDDGTMARLPQLLKIAQEMDLKIISIKDLVAYRMQTERLVQKEGVYALETKYGKIEAHLFNQLTSNDQHIAFKIGDWDNEEIVPVRVFSPAEPSESFVSLINDQNNQLHKSMHLIQEQGKGLLLYMRHSDKYNDLKAWLQFQSSGESQLDKHNNPENEQRDFGIGAQIIREMGIKNVRLLTANPKHRVGIAGYGIIIKEVLPI